MYEVNSVFLATIAARRTYYSIGDQPTISDEQICETVEFAVKYCPSAFNSQSQRTVILLEKQHKKLWEIVREELRKIVPAAKFASTDEKISSFAAGYGSVLFFEDLTVIENMQKAFPTYSVKFPEWSQHASGMLQLIIWTALESAGFGASLQHYNPVINQAVAAEWRIPEGWSLVAQMPFGNRLAEPQPKQFQPLEERVKVYK